jgi:hypothetical protein
MLTPAILVFTYKSIETILAEGGTSGWVLDAKRAARFQYVICTRNRHDEHNEGEEPHGSAFLLGRIRDVVPAPERAENRMLIRFSEFARINIPDVWKGWRNPVRYTNLEELDINWDDEDWEPMPQVEAPARQGGPFRALGGGLSIAAAKKGLAAFYGVTEDAIEILIRG